MAEGLHISVAAEPVFRLGPVPVTNSLLVTWLVMALFGSFALWYQKESQKKKPSRAKLVADSILLGLLKFFKAVAGERAKEFYPLLATFFIFIIVANWSGLLPGVGAVGFWEHHGEHKIFVPFLRGATADLNTTLALALVSVGAAQYLGIKALGWKKYLSKFFNFANPIKFFIGILELVSEFAKVFSFSFRLFGNIFAGEVLLAVMAFLLPFFVPIPFLVLEIFVGFIQALVFAMLSLVFISLAISDHEAHEAHSKTPTKTKS